jgi:WD40 repeat protein
VAFNAESTLLASAGSDGTARIWDVASGRQLHVLSGAPGPIGSVSFSPNGEFLAASAAEGAATVWDTSKGTLVATLYVALDENDWLVNTPNGMVDGSASAIEKQVWRMSPRLDDVNDGAGLSHVQPGLLQSVLNSKRESKVASGQSRNTSDH